MAVRAHEPRDFCTRIRNNLLEELDDHHHPLHRALMNPLLLNRSTNEIKDSTAASNQRSGLTVNGGSGSRKRIREDWPSAMDPTMPVRNVGGGCDPNMVAGSVVDQAISADQMRVVDSMGTSTSGRISSASASSSPNAQDLAVHLYNHSLEVDALIRLQNERLRLGLEQAQKRHCISLISLLEQLLAKKLEEKDAELEIALRRNAELEERVRQASAESQIWFNFAKNNEAIVANLKTCLARALLQHAATCDGAVHAREGYGDSDGAVFLTADEAQSCCVGREGKAERDGGAVRSVTAMDGRRACKVCRVKDVGVLLLPCRHLCLCVDCEPIVDACPVCHVGKNASLQIFMP